MDPESSISSWLTRLPQPRELFAYARASMAAQAAWELRNDVPCEPVSTMEQHDDVVSFYFPSAEGDNLVLRFGPNWALVIAYDHESEKGPYRHETSAPSLWPGLTTGLPAELGQWLNTPRDEDGVLVATAVAWNLSEMWLAGEDVQTDGDITLQYDDGVATLLDPFIGGLNQFAEQIQLDYELDLSTDDLRQLVSDSVVSRSVLEHLAPGRESELAGRLETLGYGTSDD